MGRHLLAVRMQVRPIHASHEIFPRVRILPKTKATIAATATYTAVQVAWLDTAFKPIEIPSIPEPAVKIHPNWYIRETQGME